jgi:hypothetical protein
MVLASIVTRQVYRHFQAASAAGCLLSKIGNYEIYSCNGQVAVDFLGRYENLEADLAHVMQQIGVKARLQLGRLNSQHRDRSISYRDWYDDESRELIRKTYAREIELLNYDF